MTETIMHLHGGPTDKVPSAQTVCEIRYRAGKTEDALGSDSLYMGVEISPNLTANLSVTVHKVMNEL